MNKTAGIFRVSKWKERTPKKATSELISVFVNCAELVIETCIICTNGIGVYWIYIFRSIYIIRTDISIDVHQQNIGPVIQYLREKYFVEYFSDTRRCSQSAYVSVRFEHKCDNKRTLTMDSEKFTELVRDYTPLYDQPSKHMMIMSKKKKKKLKDRQKQHELTYIYIHVWVKKHFCSVLYFFTNRFLLIDWLILSFNERIIWISVILYVISKQCRY